MVAHCTLVDREGYRVAFRGGTTRNTTVNRNYRRGVDIQDSPLRIGGADGDRTVCVGGADNMRREDLIWFLKLIRQGVDVERRGLLTGKDDNIKGGDRCVVGSWSSCIKRSTHYLHRDRGVMVAHRTLVDRERYRVAFRGGSTRNTTVNRNYRRGVDVERGARLAGRDDDALDGDRCKVGSCCGRVTGCTHYLHRYRGVLVTYRGLTDREGYRIAFYGRTAPNTATANRNYRRSEDIQDSPDR